MRKIYFVQPNSQYGESVYFPYAAAVIAAYAMSDDVLRSQYTVEPFIYKRLDFDDALALITEPFAVAFSCYTWNYEYNKHLAQLVKEKHPGCITIFGGHQISESADIINEAFADYLIFGEGEEIFRRLLLSFVDGSDSAAIPNLAFKRDGKAAYTIREEISVAQPVSPYLSGYFDAMLESEKDLSFSAILETNRGCPNRCAFCDWGNIRSKVRLFSLETVKKEIDWMADNKIEYCYCADANFGLFKRDEEIIEYLIKVRREKGFPLKFQTTFSKSNAETVFAITKKLNDAGMCKGATLSFQSMSEDVLKNIYRQNMPLEHFMQLMRLYHQNNIAAYSELILGLPGENYESFRAGLETLLDSGQHMAINVFNCEQLANSIMGERDYIEKYKIETARIEQHQYHTKPNFSQIKEYSDIVVSTTSMTREQWKKCNILEVYIRCFHNLGPLQCFAIFLHCSAGVEYMDFYERLIRFSYENPRSVCGEIVNALEEKYDEILSGGGSLTMYDERFGTVTWPLDEWAFLRAVSSYDELYVELDGFLRSFFSDGAMYEDILSYQKAIVKTPYKKSSRLTLSWDLHKYFSDILNGSFSPPQKKKSEIIIHSENVPNAMADYAREIVWYGRKGSQNIITDVEYI